LVELKLQDFIYKAKELALGLGSDSKMASCQTVFQGSGDPLGENPPSSKPSYMHFTATYANREGTPAVAGEYYFMILGQPYQEADCTSNFPGTRHDQMMSLPSLFVTGTSPRTVTRQGSALVVVPIPPTSIPGCNYSQAMMPPVSAPYTAMSGSRHCQQEDKSEIVDLDYLLMGIRLTHHTTIPSMQEWKITLET
jgi:hypothetical protein